MSGFNRFAGGDNSATGEDLDGETDRKLEEAGELTSRPGAFLPSGPLPLTFLGGLFALVSFLAASEGLPRLAPVVAALALAFADTFGLAAGIVETVMWQGALKENSESRALSGADVT